ncbi:HU family DNA-binding protein (plasmid) [Candidatus Trichorickettsia mobilis]|uniref:HU family DNA-binding protein n=1 Tax=Candidatus Trichorickettsia mobilis TaxID=1346319 RepID=UPI002B25D557|nr:HU family DNA-binding protein [Candidatus Trichorickettsia mobilis]WPY01569.1 HU family DNA-binding protein [Candidatus Trichorickettsia mobilis]
MNKEQFVKYIAENMECDEKTAEVIIDIFAENIYMAISEGHEIDINNLGKFAIKNSPIRKNQCVKRQPYFVPAEDLKLACNY